MPIPSPDQWRNQTNSSRLARTPELRNLDAAISQYGRLATEPNLRNIKTAFEEWKRSQGAGWQQTPWGRFPAMRELDRELSRVEDRDDVLARLAGSDVVGLRQARNQETYKQEVAAAYKRYFKECKPDKKETFYHMLDLLRDARVTINFTAWDPDPKKSFFGSEDKSQSYQNFWERGVTGGTASPVRRDKAELQIGQYRGLQDIPGLDKDKVLAAKERLATYGAVRTSPDFKPAFRPHYGALDFGFYQCGACGKYGRSFFILKEHMKHKATYTHVDSFKVNVDLLERKDEYGGVVKTLDDVTATYHELGKIILYCHPVMLRAIYEYASGKKAKGSEQLGLGVQDLYIEAQLHVDVQFKLHVESVFVSRAQMGPDAATQNQVEKNAKLFGTANGVKVEFY